MEVKELMVSLSLISDLSEVKEFFLVKETIGVISVYTDRFAVLHDLDYVIELEVIKQIYGKFSLKLKKDEFDPRVRVHEFTFGWEIQAYIVFKSRSNFIKWKLKT